MASPDFVNAVVALETKLSPHDLLAALFDVEAQFGRRRDFHHAPRTLDLDLLLYDQQIIDSALLQLPHPRMHLRAFVIAPLVRDRTRLSHSGTWPGGGMATRRKHATGTQDYAMTRTRHRRKIDVYGHSYLTRHQPVCVS